MNILRRLPLSRLLLMSALVVVLGVSITALALGLSTGATPPPKPLAETLHDALAAPHVAGVSARIVLTNHLLEGASLADGSNGEAGQLTSSPLISGAAGRLWISSDGKVRLELQSEKGDTQILYDGHTVTLYDAASNTVYHYTPPQSSTAGDSSGAGSSGTSSAGAGDSTDGVHHAIPSVAEIQEGIAHATQKATLSGATPTNVAGQPAYTLRISPSHNGGLIGGAELSWDANTGVPLRAAVYSTSSAAPVVELTATEISYGPVESSVFEISPPANAKVEEVKLPGHDTSSSGSSSASEPTNSTATGTTEADASKPKVSRHGSGLEAITEIEAPLKPGETESTAGLPEGLPQVKINGATATELPTSLGTLLSFERSGIRYLLIGSVTPAAIEAFARGL